ncbi:MAG: gliding motility-associated C-terminal domain-containing protein [Chitinophagaceae bacterium]
MLRNLAVTGFFLFLSATLKAQNCIPTGISGAVFNFACNQVCNDLNFQVPHIKSTDDYTRVSVPYAPYPYNTPTGSEDINLYNDDEYSTLINLPFTFCFYGGNYSSTVVGSNGIITFDPANASCANAWMITTPIFFAGGSPCIAGTTYYPRASIMGAYSDLDPRTIASPGDRKIQWEVVGVAPCRKFVVSYYHIGVFGSTCGIATPNTFQIVIHESTGIVEIFTERKACNSTTNAGRAILGIQNWNQDKAVADPAKNNAVWSETNTGYRFIPSAGTSRFVKSELFTLGGVLVATADTITTVAGLLDIRFPNVCPPAGSTQYEVRTTFSACDNPATQLISSDIITVNRTNSLNATATSTNATCGPPDGTITVTVPAGVGTPPYTFILDGGAPFVGPSPHTFTNVAAGPHTIVVTDATAGCTSTINQTVLSSGILGTTNTTTATACAGVNNGSITITSAAGIGPYTFALDGGLPQAGTIPFTFSNLASGTHNVVVNDLGSGCNSGVLIITVPIGAGLNGTAVMTPTSCITLNNGTITANALSGTAPYTYQLDAGVPQSGANPYTFTNVAAGLHTVIIRDFFNCNITLNVTVGAGAGVTGTTSSTATACTGINNGTITAMATSGTAPFIWSLDGGAPQNGASPYTFINVAAGAHNITITDNTGCSVVLPVTVNTGPGVTGNGTSTATSCTGINDGTITTTATSGTAPFTWSLDGGAPQAGTSPYTFTNVAPGSHNITITDVNGCSVVVPVTVTAGATPTATASSTPTACTGVNNGTITITSSSIAGPYTFSLDGGAPQAGTIPFTFINVAAGTHNIVVTGAGGCATNPFTETVLAGSGVTGSATTTATSCPAATNGSITVDATAGTAPFTYQLDAGAPQSGSNPFTFNNVSAGPHTVVIRDNLGCSFTLNPTVNPGLNLTASAAPGATSCSGASDGTITVTPLGGIAPFIWSIDGGPFVPGPSPHTFTNLAAGPHTIIVTDAAGCSTLPFTPTVAAGPSLTTTVNTTAALCNGGATGTIIITQPTIGTPPYQYSLDNVVWQASNTFTGLAAGNYTAYYRESNGCQGSQPVTVTEPALLTGSTAQVAVVCNGQANGTITVTPGGGVGPYQYSIDGGLNWQSSNIFNVAANNYTITIRDANGCTIIRPGVIVTEPAVLTANSVNTGASCNGGSDGTITVTATGGNAGYQYSLDGVVFQTSNVFNVVPGTYTVTVKDNLGCITSFPATVTLTGNLTFTPQTDVTICEGESTPLQLVSNASSYSWLPTTGLSDPTVPNPVADPRVPTAYYVTATLGLCSVIDTVMVNVNAAPIPDGGPAGFICYGQSYILQGSGGTQFLWTPSTGLSSVTAPNAVATPTKTTTYTLSIISDLNGCASLITDNVIVDVTPPIKVTTFPYDTIGYPLEQFQLNATSAATNYTWTPTTGLSNAGVPNPVVTVGNIGDDIIYQVTASTAAGCKGEGYVRIRVFNGPDLYVPTAFTPNGDGRNERFYPFPVGIKSINYFRVFNRWGQLVFSSTTLNQGWDGRMQGADQPTGVYVWMAQGVTKDDKVITKKGTVTVIR